ncbi:nitric oxide-associated protein 1 [Arctopsyche grandis]|uniref:nitric oxide-associated protein 1 n=1 Tax=Arctopsyche grandis TaxID=121162 RepID=UPI00406DA332
MFARSFVLRLCFTTRKRILFQTNQYVTSSPVDLAQANEQKSTKETLQSKIDKYSTKIRYNTITHGTHYSYLLERHERRRNKAQERILRTKQQSEEPLPLSLTCLPDFKDADLINEQYKYDTECDEPPKEKRPFQLPFGNHKKYFNENQKENVNGDSVADPKGKHWMTDYDSFDDAKISKDVKIRNRNDEDDLADEYESWRMDYGTPDPTFPASKISCNGCGAILHCIDTMLPGYLPSELFKGRRTQDLMKMACQRCHFLKEYNIALNVSVSPEEYPKIIAKLKPERALVLLVVDILDFPNSIWPDIIDIIGYKRPVIVVGNKVDLLPPDAPGYLQYISMCLKHEVSKTAVRGANIKDVALISAKTGFGIEDLITKLHNIWQYKGDVYIVGCTNVGKSTLFNAFLQSDYCKVAACDLLDRATVSQWPGTTLNLLKFPILRPSDWKIYMRQKRLKEQMRNLRAEKKLRSLSTGNPNVNLLGYVGRTFANADNMRDIEGDPFSYQMSSGFSVSGSNRGINEYSEEYRHSKWCYDTPGVVHPEQILSILTLEELKLALPKSVLVPRTFFMHANMTLFVAGLGRLDLLEKEEKVCFTVFASEELPITVCDTDEADEMYSEFVGTELFGVPIGDDERLSKFPKLKSGAEIDMIGEGENICLGDITLSSAGWVSVSGSKGSQIRVLPWTPDGRGICLRRPALLPNAVTLKGKRMKDSPAYNVIDIQI